MFTPSTNLRLLNVPLEAGYSDTLWFPDVNTQTQYFLGKVVKAINDFNFIKKDNTITINGNVETYYNCNYIMYQNANFSNKWFYAFINRIEWASNSSTRLYCSTDCIQTWFFDITYYKSFIERQHSTTDTAGDNITPEPIGVVVGKYQSGGQSINIQPDKINIFATCTAAGSPVGGGVFDGMYSGAGLVVSTDSAETANGVLSQFVQNGLASAVAKVQCTPATLDSQKILQMPRRPESLNGYVPRNQKLKTGQFVKIVVNAMGQQLKINPDYNDGDTVVVTVSCAKSTGEIIAVVSSYGATATGEQSLVCKIPESTWAYNQYKNEYNLHSASNAIAVERMNQQRRIERTASLGDAIATGAGIAGSIVGSISSGNIIAGAQSAANVVNVARRLGTVQQYAGGFDEITQALQFIDESYNAPAVGGVTQGSPFVAAYQVSLDLGFLVPPARLVRIYDDYLTVYGYAQNIYAVPNLHARKTWTYLRVPSLKASGDFPDEDFSDIQSAFAKGITFWDYTKTFGDYSQDNSL